MERRPNIPPYQVDSKGYYFQAPEGKYRPIDIIDNKLTPLSPAIISQRQNRNWINEQTDWLHIILAPKYRRSGK